MKLNKWIIISAIIVIVLIAAGAGAYFLLGSTSSTKPLNTLNQGQQIKKLTPEDIGLTLTVRPDKKGVVMKITKLTDIVSIEYEFSYDAEETQDGETAIVPKGIISGDPVKIKPGESSFSRDLDLGTCSKNVCRFDKVKSDISVAIKVNYKNGTVGGVDTKIKL